jgi:hypothetical protein
MNKYIGRYQADRMSEILLLSVVATAVLSLMN